MRFYADADVPAQVVAYLRQRGHKCITAAEMGFERRDDAFHYAYAKRQRRILLTLDKDFLNLRKYPLQRHPGIIVVEPGVLGGPKAIQEILRRLFQHLRYARDFRESRVLASLEGFTRVTPTFRQRVEYR